MNGRCYLLLMSSGLDSTVSILNLINDNSINFEDSFFFPMYIYWRSNPNIKLDNEFNNCIKILDYIRNKYDTLSSKIKKLKTIEIPFIYFEIINTKFKKLRRNDCWPHLRNAIFIMSSLSYLINYLSLKRNGNPLEVVIVTGFTGNEVDENDIFTRNIEKLINDSVFSDSHSYDIVKNIKIYSPYCKEYNSGQQYFDIQKFNDGNILSFTWSCWDNVNKPCKTCPGCMNRKEKYKNFKSFGGTLIDTVYE